MSRIRMTTGERAFTWFNTIFMILLSLTFILPFFMVLSTSFVSSAEAARRGEFVLWPEKIDLSSYKLFLSQGSTLWRAYGVTIARIAIGTVMNLAFTSTLAYGLSKQFLPGRQFFIGMIFATMIISGGLLPSYLVIKSLKLTNTFWAMIIPGLVTTWNFILMKSFFVQLPQSLEESAMIDGATPLRILVSVVLPVSLPVMATIGLFYAVGHWNAWFDVAIYINKKELYPVQILLRNTVLMNSTMDINNDFMAEMLDARPTPASIRSACIIITTVPILCIYPFLQKYFVKGVMIGSIKE